MATEHGAASGNPVAAALLHTIKAHGLPRTAFDNYCEARIFDLYDDPMPSRNDLEGYCGETASALIQLASLILDAECCSRTRRYGRACRCRAGRWQDCCVCCRCIAAAARYTSRRTFSQLSGQVRPMLLDGSDKAAIKRAIDAMMALAEDHFASSKRPQRLCRRHCARPICQPRLTPYLSEEAESQPVLMPPMKLPISRHSAANGRCSGHRFGRPIPQLRRLQEDPARNGSQPAHAHSWRVSWRWTFPCRAAACPRTSVLRLAGTGRN